MDLSTVERFVPAADTTWQPGDAYLAGGSWLFSEPQPAVRRLLDLTSFGWPALVEHDDGLEVAATCTLAELAAFHAPKWPAVALFAQCAGALLASYKVWHVATVGGNVCLALPAAPMVSLAAGLDATATLWAPEAQARVADLVIGPGRTTLRPGQLLRSIHLPAVTLRSRTAFRQFSLAPMGRSAAVVIGRVGADGATVTVTAATPGPVQLRFAEMPAEDEVVAAIDASVGQWHDDVHGAPEWRRAITLRLVREIVAELR